MKISLERPSASVLSPVLLAALATAATAHAILPDLPDLELFDPTRPPRVEAPDLVAPDAVPLPARFVRGDADGSGKVDLADGLATLSSLFVGDRLLGCLDAADANDDGSVAIADAIHTFTFLFVGGVTLAAPYPACGVRSGPGGLGCEAAGVCAPVHRTALFQITPVDGGCLIDLPEAMVMAIPDGVGLGVASISPRSAAAAGVLHRVSRTAIFLQTDSAALGHAAGLRLRLTVEGEIAFPPPGTTCGSFACICSGPSHCEALSESGSCGVVMVDVEDASGDAWSVCRRALDPPWEVPGDGGVIER
jgi:hypothetical protein